MKSATARAAAVKKKLDKKLAMKRPWFPKAWAKSVEKLKGEYAYWSELAKRSDANAMADFGEATGLDALLGKQPGVVQGMAAAPTVQAVTADTTPVWQHPAVLVSALVLGVVVVGAVAGRR